MITFELSLAKLGLTYFLADLFGPGLFLTVEFGIDSVGRQRMPSVNSVLATGFSPSISEFSSLSVCDLFGTTTSSGLRGFNVFYGTCFRELVWICASSLELLYDSCTGLGLLDGVG